MRTLTARPITRSPWGVALLIAALAVTSAPGDASARRKKKRKAKPAATAPVAQEGTLTIFSTSNGALVQIDGKGVGNLPLEDGLKLPVGQHAIRVSMRGWTEYIDTFTIKPGEETELEIDLIPVAGIVKIDASEQGATVKVNGKVLGVTPFDQDVPAGKADLTVFKPGFKEHKEILEVMGGKSYDLKVKLEPLPAGAGPGGAPAFYQTWWFWTVVGVAVAGGATATALAASGGQDKPTPADFTLQIP